MKATPKISIGLPVYNGATYLTGAIQSLLDQSFTDFELIISDNASRDSTGAICRRFAALDHRIRYFCNDQNIGLAANQNRVIKLAKGEYFKFAAHDDLYPCEMLRRCYDTITEAGASVCLVYSHFEMIDEKGASSGIGSDPIEKKDSRPYVRLTHLLKNVGRYSAYYGLVRTETLRQTRGIGLFPISDKVFLAELAMLGEFREIPESLLRRRSPW